MADKYYIKVNGSNEITGTASCHGSIGIVKPEFVEITESLFAQAEPGKIYNPETGEITEAE